MEPKKLVVWVDFLSFSKGNSFRFEPLVFGGVFLEHLDRIPSREQVYIPPSWKLQNGLAFQFSKLFLVCFFNPHYQKLGLEVFKALLLA